MPGILGIISKRSQEVNNNELELMSGSLHMESFYHSGKLAFADCGIYVGWTCHKEAFCDCLPINNEKKDITLIYSGENFNDPEDMDEIKKRNHSYDKKNASYIVHMYEEWGEDFLAMLNGNFHGLLIDRRNGKTILFNDRYGMHRLYYYEGKEAFYFSSEAKAILGVLPPEARQIDLPGLAEFFSYRCVLDNRSLFQNIFLLPGGSAWMFGEDGKVEKKTYFHPSSLETQPLLESEFHYERLVYTLQKLLKRYFRAEDRIGIPLSKEQGVRVILAHALFGPEKVPCYSLGGPFGDTEDSRMAQQIVEATGQALHMVSLDNNFVTEYPRLAQDVVSISDGAVDISGAAELYLHERAREIAPIQVSGAYGAVDLRKEKLIHRSSLDGHLFDREFLNVVNEVAGRFKELSSDSLTFSLSAAIPWSCSGKLSIGQSQMTVRTPLLDNDLVGLMYRALDEVREGEATLLRLVRDGNPLLAEKTAPESKKVLGFLPGRLRKRDHENRSPYPGLLFRNELSGWVREVLLDRRSMERPYLNKSYLEKILTDHTQGKGNHKNAITSLINAELIHRFFIDKLHV